MTGKYLKVDVDVIVRKVNMAFENVFSKAGKLDELLQLQL